MAVSTAIFNQDVQNPIAYAQDIVAKQKEQEAASSAQAYKRSQANAKEIGDMIGFDSDEADILKITIEDGKFDWDEEAEKPLDLDLNDVRSAPYFFQ